MRRVALACGLLLAAAAPAHAAELGRLGLGHSIDALVADPAGGAWVLSSRDATRTTVTRMDADRPARSTRLLVASLEYGALGPDGLLWSNAYGGPIRRTDREGRVSIAAEFPFPAYGFGTGMATGPDGRLWTTTLTGGRLARISPTGVISVSPFPVAGCEDPQFAAVARAADDAMWFADSQCRRLVRVPREGPVTVLPTGELEPVQLEPDPAGGMWFLAAGVIGHSGGARHPVEESIRDIAVTSDGTVWAADGSCTLTRLGGAPVPAPTRVLQLDASPAGLVLAGATRVFAGLEGPRCDDTPPAATIRPRRLSLADLRRGKLRVSVKEPVDLSFIADDAEFVFGKLMRRAGTWRLKPSRALLRHLEGKRSFYFNLRVADADGNEEMLDGYIRLTMR